MYLKWLKAVSRPMTANLLLSDEEKAELLRKEPHAAKYIRPLISAQQFLNGENRWCLWLVDAVPAEIRRPARN